MRAFVLLRVVAAGCFAVALQAQGQKPRTPVLVELFTSEGCSSCPPADTLLARLLHEQPFDGAQIIALGEHVDYWDGLGWHDRFSSAQFTARQTQYSARFHLDSIYTPQMVVDGAAQFVGNDQGQARRSIAEASRAVKLPLVISAVEIEGRKFSASVSAASAGAEGEVFAALVDPMDTTDVRNGENGGRRLNHVSVVRTLVRIGSTRDVAGKTLSFSITAPAASTPETMQLVVFAQSAELGRVIGIAVADTQDKQHNVEQSMLAHSR